MSGSWLDELRQPCPEAVGQRIELIAMPDDPDPIAPGSRGTVTGGTGGQMRVAWDCGRSIMLIPGADHWRRVPPEAG